MQIILDGASFSPDWEPAEESSLLDVVRRVGDDLLTQKRLIVVVKVDGDSTRDTEDPMLSGSKPQSVETLELVSEPCGTVALRVLYEAARQIPNLCSALTQVSANIQSRKVPEAMNLLADCIATWEELHQGIINASIAIGIAFAEVRVGEKSGEDIAGDLLQVIEQASEMLENEDYNELADLMQYEAEPNLRQMQEVVYKVISMAEKARH